jgi:hypothetical protein
MSAIHTSASGLQRIKRGLINANLANVVTKTAPAQAVALLGGAVGQLCVFTPRSGAWDVGLAGFVGFADAAALNVVLCNVTAGDIDPAAVDYDWSILIDSFRRPSAGAPCYTKQSITFDAANCVAASATVQTPAIPGADAGDSILVAVPAAFPAGVGVGVGAVTGTTPQIPFVNPTAGDVNPASLTYDVVLIKGPQRQSPSGQAVAIKGSVTFDAPNNPTIAVTNWSVPIAGTLPGDVVAFTARAALTVAPCVGRCNVAGTVVVPCINPTGGGVNPGSQTYDFMIFR